MRAPGLDLCERRDVVDRWLHVPHLIRVDHEYCSCGTRILPYQRRALWVSCWLVSFREVLRVVNYRADQLAASQVVREVCADFYLEVVETGPDGFFCQASNFGVRVPWR